MEKLKNVLLGASVIILALLALGLVLYVIIGTGVYLIDLGVPNPLAFLVVPVSIAFLLLFISMSEDVGKAIRRKL